MTCPYVTVVVPTHGRPAALARCLEALARQDYPAGRLQILVVNDGGPAVSAPEQVTLIDQANAGPSAARNAGLAAAEGDVIGFVDDDCEPARTWATELVAAWRREPSRGYGGQTVNARSDSLPAEVAQRIIDAGYARHNRPGDARFLASNNMLFPLAELRELGGFDPSLRTSEDRDLCDRWHLSGRRLEYVPSAVVHHSHPGGRREFWRQHVTYARGARRFHVLHRRRTGSLPAFEPAFYAGLLRQPGKPALRSRAWLTVWLAASASGYAAEVLRPSSAEP